MNKKEKSSLPRWSAERNEATIAELLGDDDSGNLSLAKANWYFGEWEELTEINLNQLKNHPDLAIFSVLKASGFQQLDQIENCRKYVEIAKSLDCDPKLISTLLIAGIQNSLGKIAAIQGRTEKAKGYFSDSVNIGNSGRTVSIAAHARSVKQLASMGLIPEVEKFIEVENRDTHSSNSEQLEKSRINYAAVKAFAMNRGLDLVNDKDKYPDKISLQEILGLGKDVDLVVAGMRHSGSTALFNLLRLALESLGIEFESGYSETTWLQQSERKTQLRLIKTHEIRDDLIVGQAIIISTVRDLRDTVASAARREWGRYLQLGAVEYAKFNRSLNEMWNEQAHYTFNYEQFITESNAAVSALLGFLDIDSVDIAQLMAELKSLPTDNWDKTLLSPTHITDPKRLLSYIDTLSQDDAETITRQNYKWLLANGYV
ncbi:MAG: hypothetical protein DRR42_28315 [Gammaproteobacteria bacterium]|nr:MAG: hypothetical protein DRR42_28315 [Gammaproteobacteria bacterium]